MVENAIKYGESGIIFDYTKSLYSGRPSYVNGYEWSIIEYDDVDYTGCVKVGLELKDKIPKLKTAALGIINIQHIRE